MAVRQTVAIPSRASPLTQCRRKSSGSWLACDAGTEGCQANRGDTIASKPAPTMSPQVQWELACRRCRHRGLSGKPWRYHREQARSHNVAVNPVGAGLSAMQALRSVRQTVAMPSRASPLPQRCAASPGCCEHRQTCGSWLACDGSNAVYLPARAARIASKPAPTITTRLPIPAYARGAS